MNHPNSYQSEKKTIQLSMILLFLALLVIYILLFSIKGETLKNNLTNQTTSPTLNQNTTPNQEIIIKDSSPKDNLTTHKNEDEDKNKNENENNTGIYITATTGNQWTISNMIQTHKYNTGELDQYAIIEKTTTTGDSKNNNNLDNNNNIRMLSGTQRYYGPIKIIEKLGIKYQYALKDSKNIYYIYLWDYNYDFDTLARLWSGNVYKMTEQAIIKNNLFWEELSFINLPDYQNQTVIILVHTNQERRLIQIDYAIYHQSKQYLKNLFGY